MINKKSIIVAVSYFVLIIISEAVLHYSTEYFGVVNDYAMPITVLLFVLIAWMFKTDLSTVIMVVPLLLAYGALAFYMQIPTYYPSYPSAIIDFADVILIKCLFFSFPLVIIVALKPNRKKRAEA